MRPASIEEQTLDDFDVVMRLNVRCAMQCLQAVLPGMKAAGFGRVVNVSSRAALGKELRTIYAGSKAAALQGLAKVWALELGQHGITANAIGPGPIKTEPVRPGQSGGQSAYQGDHRGGPGPSSGNAGGYRQLHRVLSA